MDLAHLMRWLETYSVILLPVLVIAEQIGIPLPAVPALLDVPIDHHAGAAVAGVPFGHQVRLPGAELLGVRCARCAATP